MSANKKPWEGVRWTRPRPPPSFTTIITDNRNVSSTEELFDVMHAQFSKASARHLDVNAAAALIDSTPQFTHREFPPISAAEVREALDDTSESSSPGPDKITWRILKKATWVSGAIEGLASLYNCSVESGVWPDWFKSSECVIIPKPNKPDYTVPKAYRPHRTLNLYHHLPDLDTAQTTPLVCLLAVVVLLLGPLLGPKLLFLVTVCSPFSLTLLSS